MRRRPPGVRRIIGGMDWTVSLTRMGAYRQEPASDALILDGRPEDTERLVAILREHGGGDAVRLAEQIAGECA